MRRRGLLGGLAVLVGCGPAGSSESATPEAPSPPRTPLEAAKREVPITMFMTTWCPVCQRASRYLAAKGYRLREVDVERDVRAAAAMVYVNPRGAVPMFEIDGDYAIGWSVPGIEKLVTAAAMRLLEEGRSDEEARPPRPSSSRDPDASAPR